MQKFKLVIGLCTGGTVRAETLVSLISNIYNLGAEGIQANVLVQMGGYVDINRNKIAEATLDNKATHLLFVDSDMIFPDDGIERLIKLDKDIVGANYNVRLDPKSPNASGPTVKILKDGVPSSVRTKDLPKKLFKCYAIPTGFMMIKTEVLRKIPEPWFLAHIDSEGKHHTEDIEFCRKAGEAGIDVYCDPTIEMGHIGSAVY